MIETESKLDRAEEILKDIEWRLSKFVAGNPRIYEAMLAIRQTRIQIAKLKEREK